MWPLASFLADTVLQSSLTATGQLPCLAVALWVVAAGQLPYSTLLGCGRWPTSSLPVLLRPLASFLAVTVFFVANGQLPQCQCSLCGRPLLSFSFSFFFEHNHTLSGKKTVTEIQVVTTFQVQIIGCRSKAILSCT